ncbi:HNH nuclease domain-containing protein OS=Tsukamurella paurometabola (strain ATCC 8368 / DSM/ CCUG 35730 / CIP 100753 / JCM 10117 / KCTC 9821 / NBRC 16120/ NCIMB 702349 / NCTC 13040) OX=521096 GN=Tpau_0251 PE=4 SV=1 [Tsukamurella paurometabola]|uniref:HNH nuclease domain-containing protein n=1 Tax=Tsukamurella paurometabola (strain ATCC 8368 / DSM 20162 / CCUG 35730 / CIP 100753 / JCM 10117 / KCTC 9821 / NBRC 16120 / NCIMB 702349 / NCTC 13040) TaxID=521096 RepID=D5UQR8_TSUPD|nr:hypothetical protein [Tsukamurella paurometabola]ADG76901.1 conserved hypothetical protein [Tsukamurella paurometabola DSM 20162]SUP42140.1 Uncharacterised protein [Tsukamurella paurometabola]
MAEWEEPTLPGMPAPPARSSGRPAAAGPAPRRAFTTAPPPRAITAFTAKLVPIETGCVIFTGAISTPDGYGRVTITLPGTSKPVTVSAHRFAFWTHHGALPDEGVLEHHCNEPLCVRIATDHVHASTQSANLIHAINSGRHHNSETVVDSARRADHSRAVRALVIDGFDAGEYRKIRTNHATAAVTLPLF